MIKTRYAAALLVAAMALPLAACDSDSHEDVLSKWAWADPRPQPDPTPDPEPEPDPEPPAEANPAVVAQGWENVSQSFGDLPEHISVYTMNNTTGDNKSAGLDFPVIAYLAVADMATARFEVSGGLSGEATGTAEAVYTPQEFYESYDHPAVVVNGGLFFSQDGKWYSQNSLYSNGRMLSANQTYYTVNWSDMWYPTLGFFYQDNASGDFHAGWTYYVWPGNDYFYSDCKQTDPDTPCSSTNDVPSATHPTEGVLLNAAESPVRNGIGGVSVLVRDGVVRDTWALEMLDVSASSRQPRTAVGWARETNRLVFFVCQGRGVTEGVMGMTTLEVANALTSIGVTEALNLDGGGSSCMLVNGRPTILGSDTDADGNPTQRRVIDACFIR